MRTTATVLAFAIATSLVAGQDFTKTKSSKSKSDGDDCAPRTNCSADTLTRTNLLTKLVVDYYGNDEGVIDPASIEETCAADAATKDAFDQAVENTAGAIMTPFKCQLDTIMFFIKLEGRTISDADMQATFLGALCTYDIVRELALENLGIEYPCGLPYENFGFPCDLDPCKPFLPGPPGINALALEDVTKPADIESYLETFLGNHLN